MSSNIWFTADPHFGHTNIIKYTNRPFTTAEEMEEALIERANTLIKPGDILYLLGDVSWSTYDLNRYFSRLNTKHVHLIWGNHDNHQKTRHKSIASYDDIKCINPTLMNGTKQQITLCHYSMQHWPNRGRGAMHLYGHSHGMSKPIGRSMDVGVDTNNFFPYALEEIVDKLKNIPFYPTE